MRYRSALILTLMLFSAACKPTAPSRARCDASRSNPAREEAAFAVTSWDLSALDPVAK